MKKIVGALLLFVLLLTGCSQGVPQEASDGVKKQSRIEVYSAQDDGLLQTIDEQELVNRLLDTSGWESLERLSDDLTPEYIWRVYQEKTLLAGQDPSAAREYELIETMITFQDSAYVQVVVSDALVKNMIVPQDGLTFYYVMPDEVQKEFFALINE